MIPGWVTPAKEFWPCIPYIGKHTWHRMGPNNEGFFEWVERLEAACLQRRRDICTEVLGNAWGNIRPCLMGLPVNLLWSLVWQEVKQMLSLTCLWLLRQPVSLNTAMQKPNESLHIYVSRYSRLHYGATDKTAVRKCRCSWEYIIFFTSINKTRIADKIA